MKIAILGCGTVGRQVLRMIDEKGEKIGLEVRSILVRRPRPDLDTRQEENLEKILRDPDIDAVVETMGGLETALDAVERAMKNGKSVVTANKQIVCHAMQPLHELAEKNGVTFLYGASAGGGIPWIHNLQRAANSQGVEKLRGILNGTCNYILDAMERKNRTFEEALGQAQALGYAEANPEADLQGLDAARKCAISASLAFHTWVREEQVEVLGISGIQKEDVQFFSEMGLACRLMVQAGEREDGTLWAQVQPQLVSMDDPAASVIENQNLAQFWGKESGCLSFSGQGAGGSPTAMTVLSDLMDLKSSKTESVKFINEAQVDNQREKKTYYVRSSAGREWADEICLSQLKERMLAAGEKGWFAAALEKGEKRC